MENGKWKISGRFAPIILSANEMGVPSTAHGDVPLQAPFFLELRSEVRPHGGRIDAPSLLHPRKAKVNAPSSRQSVSPTVKSMEAGGDYDFRYDGVDGDADEFCKLLSEYGKEQK